MSQQFAIPAINQISRFLLISGIIITMALLISSSASAQTYPIVDTGQTDTCDNFNIIDEPEPGEPFYGQDAQYNRNQPSYQDNGDGTVTDLVTGLMWVQERGDKVTWASAFSGASECNVGGYNDWRMPTIKELYSLILFSGYTGMTAETSVPFLDTEYFDFVYGNEDRGERHIDCQDWSATEYVHFTMMGDSTSFGVNFADGRIKGYPKYRPPVFEPNMLYVRYVRGNGDYGINDFQLINDETIADHATGLMWMRDDSEQAMNWEDALAWVEEQNEASYLGYNDWRLPNAKELQSIVDYTRAPEVTESPAIDPLFNYSELEDGDFPWYWTGTTHHEGGPDFGFDKAVYVCFGRGTGWMEAPPPGSGNYDLLDVHGAGAQRSDFKEGDPEDYPLGHGPQGDVIRIYNHVRLVRDVAQNTIPDRGDAEITVPFDFSICGVYPNPFNPTATISIGLPDAGLTHVSVINNLGQYVGTVVNDHLQAGYHHFVYNGSGLSSGVYYIRAISPAKMIEIRKVVLMK